MRAQPTTANDIASWRGAWHKVSKTHVTLINLAHFAFVVVFLMRFANEASEQAREQHQDWGMGAMTMMMTPRLLRSIHAGFVTVAAHDPEPEPALARLHRSAHAVHVHPRPPLSPSLPVSLSAYLCVTILHINCIKL